MSIRQALLAFAWAGALAGPLHAQTAPVAPAATAAAPAPLALADALAAARDNLDARIATGALAAARADIAAADHAPLPQLSAKLSQIDLQNGIGPGNWLRDKRIDKGVGLDWTWERGDKRALRTEAARRGASAAAADLDDVRLQQQLAAHAAFFALLAAQGRQQELANIARSTAQTAATAQTRLRAGDAAVQDAARAEIEAARAQADADAAQLDIRRAQLALALLTGRDAGGLVARADWPSAEAPAAAPAAEALDQRADVRAAEQRLLAAQAAVAGAAALRKTDLTWGASFDHYPGTSTRQVELRLSMPLSFGYHYEGESARAQAQLEQARDALEKTRRGAAGELQRLQAELSGAAQRYGRYERDIVPRAREVADRAELAYRKGAMSLTDLLDARRTLRAVLLDALASRTELAAASGAWQLRTATPRANR